MERKEVRRQNKVVCGVEEAIAGEHGEGGGEKKYLNTQNYLHIDLLLLHGRCGSLLSRHVS